MADATALFSLISGISGALIGGVAGIYGPSKIDERRRRHEQELDAMRRQHDLEIARLRSDQAAVEADWQIRRDRMLREIEGRQKENNDTLAAITEAQICLREWLRVTEWTLQDLDSGRPVDVTRHDEQVQHVIRSLHAAIAAVSASPRVASRAAAHGAPPASTKTLGELLLQLTTDVRRQIVAPQPEFRSVQIRSRIDEIRKPLELFLREGSERITGRPASYVSTGNGVPVALYPAVAVSRRPVGE
ncbi:hypothetical protein ACIOUE_14355 [Streptomyces xanthochromogenes]|uniref:hypothetical protein n=1 Tax=Streptomyces TaxID=1883 RepID=UPI0013713D11|nr:hypothetical protein [Streptomyces sp. SID1034]MYV93545.1 hypothetical protein [Streptomyces sp. SID1034]